MSEINELPSKPREVIYLLKKFPRMSETFVLNEILGLENLGVEVRIFTLYPPDDEPTHESLNRLKAPIRLVPFNIRSRLTAFGSALIRQLMKRPVPLARCAWKAAGSLKPYALLRFMQAAWLSEQLNSEAQLHIHCHFGLSASTVAFCLNRLNGNPFTFTLHAKELFLERIDKKHLAEKIQAACGVVTVSEYNRKHILEHIAPHSAGKIRRIYNGVELTQRGHGALSERPNQTILTVCRLIEKKGCDVLLQACARLMRRNVPFELQIRGDGPLKADLERQAGALGLDKCVIFLGPAPHEQVLDDIRGASIVVLSNRRAQDGNMDALPTVLLEALAAGTPVICSAISGNPEIVEDEVSGVLIPPEDPDALANQLERLLTDTELRQRLAEGGRARAAAMFDQSKNIREFAAFLATDPCDVRKPLHVGYVLTVCPRLSETFILREILELERLGVRVTIFSAKRPLESEPRHSEFDQLRAEIIYLSPWWHAGPSVLWAHLVCFARTPGRYLSLLRMVATRLNWPTLKKFWRAALIANEVKWREIDHLHCHFITGNARLTEFATMLTPRSYSMTAHAKDIYASGLSESKLKRRLRDASFVVTISEYNQRYLLEKQPKSRVELIYNGLRPSAFAFQKKEIVSPERPLRLLGVGRLVEKKGFELLVDVTRELLSRGVVIETRIVGDGELNHTLKKKIEGEGLEGHVHLLGALASEDVATHFRWADALVVPSKLTRNGDIDGMPVVILEAMAMGVPVIASRISGIPEVVRDGETGFLFAAESLDEVCRKIQELPRVDLREITKRARKVLEKEYDLERNARRLLKLFERASHTKAEST